MRGWGSCPACNLISFKIDMELVRDIHLSHAKQVIVAGIVGIARALDIEVLGEGVERE
jgi:EAL domain-containing protein (putative c-di-GMP-specific phosphodiesterase class I)